jgi:hypothetical protein
MWRIKRLHATGIKYGGDLVHQWHKRPGRTANPVSWNLIDGEVSQRMVSLGSGAEMLRRRKFKRSDLRSQTSIPSRGREMGVRTSETIGCHRFGVIGIRLHVARGRRRGLLAYSRNPFSSAALLPGALRTDTEVRRMRIYRPVLACAAGTMATRTAAPSGYPCRQACVSSLATCTLL